MRPITHLLLLTTTAGRVRESKHWPSLCDSSIIKSCFRQDKCTIIQHKEISIIYFIGAEDTWGVLVTAMIGQRGRYLDRRCAALERCKKAKNQQLSSHFNSNVAKYWMMHRDKLYHILQIQKCKITINVIMVFMLDPIASIKKLTDKICFWGFWVKCCVTPSLQNSFQILCNSTGGINTVLTKYIPPFAALRVVEITV